MYTDIISTNDLAKHLTDPDWILFDCRFDLAQPAWGEIEFNLAHIPGAVYAHLDHHLSSPITTRSGRHPLPDQDAFTTWLSACGVSDQKQVVVYDQSGGTYAVRLWWLLKYYGHEPVAVLDGGYARWLAEARETNTQTKYQPPSIFVPRMNEDMVVSAEEVQRSLTAPGSLLVDARAPARFNAEIEPIRLLRRSHSRRCEPLQQ